MASSLNSSEARLPKAISSRDTPAEQVSLPPRSCALVEHCTALQAQQLARQVGATPGLSVWEVEVVVEGRRIHQRFSLESRPMPWGGGIKFYLCCECGQRCAKLYLPQGRDRFACRHCHHLLYWDQRYRRRQTTQE